MAALFGRVPFGRSATDPSILLAQNVFIVALFFLLLGAAIGGLELWQLSLTGSIPVAQAAADGASLAPAAATTTTTTTTTQPPALADFTVPKRVAAKTAFHGQFYLSVASLFAPQEVGVSASFASADTKFVLAHIFTAVLLCYPAAVCIERRKLVFDFVASLYAIYLVFAVAVLRPSYLVNIPAATCAAVAVGFVLCFALTARITQSRELADIMVGGE